MKITNYVNNRKASKLIIIYVLAFDGAIFVSAKAFLNHIQIDIHHACCAPEGPFAGIGTLFVRVETVGNLCAYNLDIVHTVVTRQLLNSVLQIEALFRMKQTRLSERAVQKAFGFIIIAIFELLVVFQFIVW